MKMKFDFKEEFPQLIKHKQYVILGGVFLGFIALVSIIVVFSNSDTASQLQSNNEIEKRIEVSRLSGGAKTEHRLVIEYDKAIKELNKQVESQKLENEDINVKVDQLNEALLKKSEDQGVVDELASQIQALKEELEELRSSKVNNVQEQFLYNENQTQAHKIADHSIALEGTSLTTHSLKHYVPAGSYANAFVISGVDASVGINAQSEPRPVLFRIVGPAKSAVKDGYIEQIDLDGCSVTGAAMGDLSSERVFVRLLKMTCAKDDSYVVETEVQGYVAGVGKAGVRGDVVSREGDFVMQSFLAGVATSAGSGVAQKYSSPFALTSQQPSAKDVVGSSVGNGLGDATSRLSEYLIKRAEQYQPVISMPAGIEVELVFNDGFYIDGNKDRKLEKVNHEDAKWKQSSK